MGNFIPCKKPNPQIQVGAMKKYFPDFTHTRKGNSIVFRGNLFIVPEIPIYTISIECGIDIHPIVHVIHPKLHENAPHLYPNDKRLCLYHPCNFNWDERRLITNEIIHWTAAWIYFYEFWLQTGKWLALEVLHNSKNK